MADRQIVYSGTGPLPITASLTTGSVGPAMLFLSGSVYSTGVGKIGLTVSLDGVEQGSAEIWSNAEEVHRAVVPVFIPITLDKPFPNPETPPTYTFEISALTSETVGDVNDYYQISIVA